MVVYNAQLKAEVFICPGVCREKIDGHVFWWWEVSAGSKESLCGIQTARCHSAYAVALAGGRKGLGFRIQGFREKLGYIGIIGTMETTIEGLGWINPVSQLCGFDSQAS